MVDSDKQRQKRNVEQHQMKFLLKAFFSYTTRALGSALFFRPQCSEHVQKQYF
jgi:hypothetical protein